MNGFPLPANYQARTRRQTIRLALLRFSGRLYRRHAAQPVPPRKILLIRPDHLGDLLFLTPALRALREALPQAQITLLVGPWGHDVLRNNPYADEIRICPFPGFERQPKSGLLAPYRLLYQVAGDLRPQGYDTAVTLRYDHWWGAWLAAAAGIPRRIGYLWPETEPFLTEGLPYFPHHHEVEQNGRLLARLVPNTELRLGPLYFAVQPEERAWARSWLAQHEIDPGRPLVAIHPGAGAEVKQWPTAAWATVATGLIASHQAQIVLTGSAAERSLTTAIASAVAQPVFDMAGQTTLGQLAALQERCALVLGSDSGPLHLAVAMGTPTVHLHGPVSAERFGPWGQPGRHIVIASEWTCAPCHRLDWPPATLAQHRCMAAIAPERVLLAARRLLRDHFQPQPGPALDRGPAASQLTPGA
jgi:heptosyltransferase-2/heptosyltransferase-3